MVENGPSDALGVQQLRAFCRVFERQSYAAAARELGLSVPTVWEQVRAVERRYGLELLERRGRRIVGGPAAETLYRALRPLLAGLDSTFELMREGAGQGSPSHRGDAWPTRRPSALPCRPRGSHGRPCDPRGAAQPRAGPRRQAQEWKMRSPYSASTRAMNSRPPSTFPDRSIGGSTPRAASPRTAVATTACISARFLFGCAM